MVSFIIKIFERWLISTLSFFRFTHSILSMKKDTILPLLFLGLIVYLPNWWTFSPSVLRVLDEMVRLLNCHYRRSCLVITACWRTRLISILPLGKYWDRPTKQPDAVRYDFYECASRSARVNSSATLWDPRAEKYVFLGIPETSS